MSLLQLQNLAALTSLLDDLASNSESAAQLLSPLSSSPNSGITPLADNICSHLSSTSTLSPTVGLRRGKATIPLTGIDVPFHSSHLRDGVPSYRAFLELHVNPENVQVDKLVGKWVPNVIGRPFSLDYEYVRKVQEITGSEVLAGMLEEWPLEGEGETEEGEGEGEGKGEEADDTSAGKDMMRHEVRN